MESLKIALRSLRRRPGRTALTVGMISFSTWMLVFAVGLNEGTYAEMMQMATSTFTGQAQLQHPGYEETPSLFETVDDADALVAQLKARQDVVAAAPRIETGGLLSVGNRTSGALVIGIEPALERETSTATNTVAEGTLLGATKDPEALPIVLGRGLQRRLKVKLGESVTFMGQAADGSIAAEIYELVGVIESGQAEMDSNLALLRRADAAELLELGKRVHRVAIRLKSAEAGDAFMASFKPPAKVRALHWRELLPSLEPSIETDRVGTVVFLMIILVVSTLGVANAMLMTVMERRKEIGVLVALGTSPGRVVRTLLLESSAQALIGALIGLSLGLVTVLYFADVGIQMTEEPIEFGGASISTIHPIFTWRTWFYPAIIFVSASVAALWPAFKAARLPPLEAIRTEGRG